MGTPREQGDIPTSFLGDSGDVFIRGSARRAVGYFYFSGVAVQDEYITIGGRVYQFTATGVVTDPSYVEVDCSAGFAAALAILLGIAAEDIEKVVQAAIAIVTRVHQVRLHALQSQRGNRTALRIDLESQLVVTQCHGRRVRSGRSVRSGSSRGPR